MAEEHLLKMMLSTMPARAGKTVIEAIAAKAITPGNRGHSYQWAIGFMARLARRRVIVRSDTYSSSLAPRNLSSCTMC